MILSKKTVRATKAFYSPLYGNVWLGRELPLSPRQANRMIEIGLAEELTAQNNLAGSENGKRRNTRRGKAAPPGNAE